MDEEEEEAALPRPAPHTARRGKGCRSNTHHNQNGIEKKGERPNKRSIVGIALKKNLPRPVHHAIPRRGNEEKESKKNNRGTRHHRRKDEIRRGLNKKNYPMPH